jgi:hypothetical protein
MSRVALGLAVLGVLMVAVTPPSVTAAGKYDGSTSMVCAVSSVNECIATGRCELRTVRNVNFPGLIRVDVKGMKMSDLASEKPRESAIRNVDHANGKVILSGAEGDRGWILLINETSGTMSATAAGDGEGFVLFGQCALP